jgi:hypothetical protein
MKVFAPRRNQRKIHTILVKVLLFSKLGEGASMTMRSSCCQDTT